MSFIYRWLIGDRKIKGDDWNALTDIVEQLETAITNSDPPSGCFKVTNLYVELDNGTPKLRVEYEV